MTVFKAFADGFRQLWQYKRIVGLWYLSTLLFGLLVAYPIKHFLEANAGQSLRIRAIVKGFDYTFLNDFKNAYGSGIDPLLDQSILVFGLSFLLMIFLSGGAVATCLRDTKQYDRAWFWSQSAALFWRFTGLTLVFLVVQGFVLWGFWSLFSMLSGGFSSVKLENEAILLSNFKLLLPFYGLILFFTWLWQDYTKILLADSKGFFSAIWKALAFQLRHILGSSLLYLLYAICWGFLIVGNYLLSSSFTIENQTSIFLSFGLSQLFVLGRFGVKLVNIGALSQFYKVKTTKN